MTDTDIASRSRVSDALSSGNLPDVSDPSEIMSRPVSNGMTQMARRMDRMALKAAKKYGVEVDDAQEDGAAFEMVAEVLLDAMFTDVSGKDSVDYAKLREKAAYDFGMLNLKMRESGNKLASDRGKLALDAGRLDLQRAQTRLDLLQAENTGKDGLTMRELAKRSGMDRLVDVDAIIGEHTVLDSIDG